MKFTKGYFYIQMVPQAKTQFEIREGYLSDSGEFGFHKLGTAKWCVSDVASGMRIYTANTRKACAEFIETYINLILIARTQDKYINAVETMRNFVQEERRKLNA